MTHATVHQVFAATAARTPQAEFLFTESVTAAAYGIAAGAIYWGDAAAEIDRLRAAYAQAGYGHGHRVGLLLENRPAFIFHWLALNALALLGTVANPRAQLFAHLPQVQALPLLHEVNDAAVVGVVADAEIDAVTIGIRGNDDLVTA